MMRRTFAYLLTYSWLPWIQCGKQMPDADWLSGAFWIVLNLARKLYTANELIFAEYCEIHACRKREI